MNHLNKIELFSDGGARGNPGPAAIGYLLYFNKQLIGEFKQYLGLGTNNVAEYFALKSSLEKILDLKLKPDSISCYLDSELVVKQLNGIYKIKQEHLQKLAIQIKQVVDQLKNNGCQQIEFRHIPRHENKLADRLVNQALDENI